MTIGELEESLSRWPNVSGEPCWIGPRTLFHNGRPQTTVRLMVECLMGEEPDQTWRFVREYCPNKGCRNPHHYKLQTIRKYDGSPIVEPPRRFVSANLQKEDGPIVSMLPDLAACLDRTVEHPDDFRDACDFIEDDDSRGRRGMSAEELHQLFSGYPVALFERALAHVNRPRSW